MIEREKFVAFVDEKTKKAFDELNEEDPKLHRLISRAIEDLKKDPFVGIISKVDLLSYGVDGIRSALVGISYFGFAVDFAVLGVSTAVCLAIGSYLFSKMQI
jgi:Txe/YoeB family toxin of Txe-Axe toxin-antitoxin module